MHVLRNHTLAAATAALLAWTSVAHAQENSFPDWPFNEDAYSDSALQGSSSTQRPWLLRSPLANITWPRVELPRFEIFPALSTFERPRILGQNRPTVIEMVASTRQRIAARTRQAWNRSLEMLKFGQGNSTTGRSSSQRPLLSRLFGNSEPEYEGPRTVNEWMSQDRLKP